MDEEIMKPWFLLLAIASCGTEFTEMTDSPPDGWSVSDGVWGTDIDQETSTVIMGEYAVKYISTLTALVRIQSDFIPVSPGDVFLAKSIMQADALSAMRFLVNFHDVDQVFISGTTIWNAALPTINTWYDISQVIEAPATSAFARIKIGRNAASFNGYSGYTGIEKHPVCASTGLTGTHSIASGGYTTVQFDSEAYDYGGNYDTGTYQFTAPSDGVYTLNAKLSPTANPADAGMFWNARFWAGGAGYVITGENKNTGFIAVAAISGWEVSGSRTVLLTRGQTVEVQINHNNTANLVVAVTSNFSVTKVE